MISIKKYLESEMGGPRSQSPEGVAIFLRQRCSATGQHCWTWGKAAIRSAQPSGPSLQQNLMDIEARLDDTPTAAQLRSRPRMPADSYHRGRANRRTFSRQSGGGEGPSDCSSAHGGIVRRARSEVCEPTWPVHERARRVADLEDLMQVSSLIETASELKSRVDQMEQDSQHSISLLQERVST